jgi:hypothetical protein
MRIIVWGALLVVTAAGCMDGPSLLSGRRPAQDSPHADAHVAPPPPVTAEQVTAANAPATVQALQAEMDREASSGGPPAARNSTSASR